MNPFLESLMGAFGGQSSPIGTEGPAALWSQLKPWLSRISTNGALKWLPQASSQMPCQIPHYHAGKPVGPCESVAIDSCIICKRPTCLDHCFVNDHCEVVCFLCVQEMVKGAQGVPADKSPPNEAPPQNEAREEAQKKAWWALGVLGVQKDSSFEEVKTAHRKLSAQWHPDRNSGDERRFKDVQSAFEILKVAYGEN